MFDIDMSIHKQKFLYYLETFGHLNNTHTEFHYNLCHIMTPIHLLAQNLHVYVYKIFCSIIFIKTHFRYKYASDPVI